VYDRHTDVSILWSYGHDYIALDICSGTRLLGHPLVRSVVFYSFPHTHCTLLECSSVALTLMVFSVAFYGFPRTYLSLLDGSSGSRTCVVPVCSVLQFARAFVPTVMFYSCPHSHWSLLECSSVAGTCVGPFCSVLQFGHALVRSGVLHFFEQRIDTFKYEFHPNSIRKVSFCFKCCISVKSELHCLRS